MQKKLIIMRKVLHSAAFRKWGFLELENGLFIFLLVFFSFYLAFQVLNVLNYFVRNFVTTCLLFEFVENAIKRINQHICTSYQVLCNA